jgi:parallel beta-helix repeat protein
VAQGGDLQALVDGAASGATIHYGGTWNGRLTVGKPITIVGGTVVGSIRVTSSNVTLRSIVVRGPQAASFASNENAIYADGVSNLWIDGVQAGNVGNAGIRLHYVNNFTISGAYIHDAVYAGIITTSSTDGMISGGTVERVGMNGSSAANGNNAYGIALTQMSQGEPRTARITVRNMVVRDVPTWTGLDTHGGHSIVFEGNRIERTWRGVMITGPGAQGITIRGNAINAAAYMGIVAHETTGYLITGNTVSNSPQASIIVTDSSCGTLGPNTIINSPPVRDEGGRC